MKKPLLFVVFCLTLRISALAQVDSSFIYNQQTPYGTLDIRIAKSPTRYYYLQEGVTFSFRESAPGVKTNTYLDMTAWDSSPYAEGNLREKVNDGDNFVMNYRLLKPVGYNSNYAPGYPIIVMMHGSGETGNCWNSDCAHATGSYDPVVNDPPAPTSPDSELLNNDHSLLHGGKIYLDAVNLAGNKLPDDPTLPERAFPGFVLFPQNLNGWNGNSVQDALRIIRLLVKKYNIDENRIFINGLSNGGHGVYEALKRAPWMFASAILMSPIDDGFITTVHLESSIAHIPLWVFQGALDTNPLPNKTKGYIKHFRDAGAVVRYVEYPDVGHTTWNKAYNEPDFFTWMLGQNKAAVHIFAGTPSICTNDGTGLLLQLPAGFKAYQWEQEGQIVNGADSATFLAKTSAKYRARFSRTSATPAESDWNDWSPVVDIKVQNAPQSSLNQVGTVLLKDLNNGTTAQLEASQEFAHYYWYKNGVLLDFPGDEDDTLRSVTIEPGNCKGACTGNGAYTLSVSNYDNCKSAPSAAKYLFFNDQAPVNIATPSEFTGEKNSASSIVLRWKDNGTTELGYEIWRRRKSGTDFSPWQMATLTAANASTFIDQNLEPSATYQYKIRAAGANGRSDYAPAGTDVVEISTGTDTIAPSAPSQLVAKRTGLDKALLRWNASTDDTGIREYVISFEGSEIHTESIDTVYLISTLEVDSAYNFSVKAIDLAGNDSPSSNVVPFVTNVSGLFYEHSPGYWRSLDSIDWTRPEYTGMVDNFTLAPKVQEDYFYFKFDGFLYITEAGSYKFRISSDDGSRLYLNNVLIADNNGVHELKAVETKAQTLSKERQRITVEFFEFANTDSLVVEYNGPDTHNTWLTIPSEALKSNLVIATEPAIKNPLAINVYPNPADQNDLSIQVESLSRSPVLVRLIDPIGRIMTTKQFNIDEARQGVKVMPEGRLNNGFYIVEITQGKNSSKQKIVIRN
jgi:hypothetical protein